MIVQLGSVAKLAGSSLQPLKSIVQLMLAVVLIFTAQADTASAQPGEHRIATLELVSTYPEPLSYATGVRELADGSILVADPIGQVLLRVQISAGLADTIGRVGPGPQEYSGPDRVFPLPGDSTLLVDLGNGRLMVLDPTYTFVSWTPMLTPTEDELGRTVHPSFTDMSGNLYASGLYHRRGPADSAALYRIDRETGDESVIAWAWRTEYVSRSMAERLPMLEPRDDWAVGRDGRVAVVRANGYSVDWYLTDGRAVHGPPHDSESYRLDDADVEAALQGYATNEIMTSFGFGERGIEAIKMRRGIRANVMRGRDGFEWPTTLPTFRPGRTIVTPDGEAWVERHMPAGESGRVEVFDGRGVRLGYVEIPSGSRVVGFGVSNETGLAAYLARTDELGLVWLSQYRVVRAERWPPA